MTLADFQPYIVGEVNHDRFVIFSNYAPRIGDVIDGYIVEQVYDVTTDEEWDEGLSFSEIVLKKVNGLASN